MSNETSDPAQQTDDPKRIWGARVPVFVIIVAVAVLGILIAAAVLWPREDTAGPTPSGSASESSASPSPESSASAGPSSSPSPLPTDPVLPELPPVAPDEPADADGLEVAITKVEHVEGEVAAPGDVAGPAIRLTVTMANGTDEALNLAFTAITAYTGADRAPAEQFTKPGGSPLEGTLEPGATATGVYLFRVAESDQGDVTIIVDYAAGQPSAVFQGDFSTDRP